MQEFITFFSNHLLLTLTAIALFIALIVVELIRAKRSNFSITPTQATQLINHQHAVIADVRAKEAFQKGHIIDAISMTPDEIRKSAKKLEKYKGKPIIVVCTSGVESQKLAAHLIKQGYNAYSLSGGIRTWTQANMPLVKE